MRGEEEILGKVGSRHVTEIIPMIKDGGGGEKQPEAGGGGGRIGQRGRNK